MARKGTSVVEPGKPEHLFFNRDASWLKFNGRVLEEARDTTNPLLERVKFLAITASNLDEFMEVRVASILQRIEDGFTLPPEQDDDGLTENQRLSNLQDQLHHFVHEQYACWQEELLPALAAEGIHLHKWQDLDAAAKQFAEDFFQREIDPVLTPVTIDPTHPFPRVLNKAVCLAIQLKRKRSSAAVLGVLTVPRSLARLVKLPAPEGQYEFITLVDLISSQLDRMFPGYSVTGKSPFRVTRNSNLYLQEEESQSLLESVREELHNRRKGDAVRLEIEAGANEAMLEQLRTNFELERWQIFRTDGQVNLSRIMELTSLVDRPDLKYPKFNSRHWPLDRDADGKQLNIFDTLRNRDILLHHPYDSFATVEQFVEAAAADPKVLSIKQTLYRTSQDSPLFQALLDAATKTDVTVVVELMARFDEDSNIRWARSLEDAGVQVFHGIVGKKTHAKLALLVRRDPDGTVRRYAHLGTGNYNSITARFYTDVSLLTCNETITAAVQKVFNYLTAQAEQQDYRPLLVAPLTLAPGILELIAREAEHAKAGRPAKIIAKMNSLLDEKTVRGLYEASQAGVEIDLIIRGMCSLRPGLPGVSERIRVRSIIGRFLEHSRIFWFANGSTPEDETASEVYCGSADWMPRNLYSRCEAVFPVLRPELKKRLRWEILEAFLRDTKKARLLQPNGEYTRPEPGPFLLSAQQFFVEHAASGNEFGEVPTAPEEKLAELYNEMPIRRPAKAGKKSI